MNLRRFQNELIVGLGFFVMIVALLYKQGKINTQEEQAMQMQRSINEIKEVVALKEIWDNKTFSKKVREFQTVAPQSKVKWSQKGTRVTASYKELTPDELNKLVKKVLNLGVEINVFEVKKEGKLYSVELICKW